MTFKKNLLNIATNSKKIKELGETLKKFSTKAEDMSSRPYNPIKRIERKKARREQKPEIGI